MKNKNIVAFFIISICCITYLYGCKDTEKDGYISYKLLENDTYEVSGYEWNDKEKKIVIPEEYKGKKVTSIGEKAFATAGYYERGEGGYDKNIDKDKICVAEEIELPDTIEEISQGAFFCCEKLKHIKKGNNIKKIGEMAFFSCESLENFDNTDNLEILGETAFFNCKSLKKFKISDKVKDVPIGCFNMCDSLQELYIGNKVENIESGAFMNCDSVKEFFIPKNVKKIKQHAFGAEKNRYKEKQTIKCEIDKQPEGWEENWQVSGSYEPDREEPPDVLFGQKR